MKVRGFTLVEIIVVLAIFGILMIVGSDFLVSAIINSNRTRVQNEVRQNASSMMQDIIDEARKADPSMGFTFVGGPGNLQMTTVGSFPARVVSYSVDVSGVLTKTVSVGGVPQSPIILSSGSVAVLNCPLAASGCPTVCTTKGLNVSQAGSTAPLIVSLTVENLAAYTRSDFCAQTTLSQSITARVY